MRHFGESTTNNCVTQLTVFFKVKIGIITQDVCVDFDMIFFGQKHVFSFVQKNKRPITVIITA